MSSLRDRFNHSPVRVIAFMTGARDVLLGFGFLFGLDEIHRLQLYAHFDAFGHGIAGPVVGAIFLITGIIVCLFANHRDTRLIRRSLKVQAVVWLFSAMSYFVFGQFILGVVLGLFFSLLTGYLAYYFKFHEEDCDLC